LLHLVGIIIDTTLKWGRLLWGKFFFGLVKKFRSELQKCCRLKMNWEWICLDFIKPSIHSLNLRVLDPPFEQYGFCILRMKSVNKILIKQFSEFKKTSIFKQCKTSLISILIFVEPCKMSLVIKSGGRIWASLIFKILYGSYLNLQSNEKRC